jgi:phosphoribosylformylglycinamidine synthase
MNVACSGAVPIGVTDCLNFGSPETELGAWQLVRAIDGIADACRTLDMPVVSGNVSLYNETPDGPILPTPVIGTIGLLEDRGAAIGMRWSAGDELWLLGDPAADAAALAGSELAWRRGVRGGRPALDVSAAAGVVRTLDGIGAKGLITAAHDASVGGIAVALARVAIASGCGARVTLPGRDETASAVAFGERAGRVIVAVTPDRAPDLEAALATGSVVATRLGVAGGDALDLRVGTARLTAAVDRLAEDWRREF